MNRLQIREDRLTPWLTLFLAPGVGAATFAAILRRCHSPQQALATPRRLQALLPEQALPFVRHPDQSLIRRHLNWQRSPGNAILTLDDPRYPTLLRETANPPPLLFVSGRTELLDRPTLAMVGSRNPSPRGREQACALAAELAGAGFTICSGLALGIDAAAHRGALDRDGGTIAVLGTGIDRIYPGQHLSLYRRIAGQGLLVSEFPLGTGPHRSHFPQRNRIISGLAAGTIVVEASLNSGSLITARLAAEQGREVFAFPGNIHNPTSRGCHVLIREGATLVENSVDILAELPAYQHPERQLCQTNSRADFKATSHGSAKLSATERQVIEKLGDNPTSVDELIIRSGLTADEVSSILLVLELQGYITADQGRFRLNPDHSGDSDERKCVRSPDVPVRELHGQ